MIYTGSAPATGLGHGDVELLRGLDAQDAANSSVEVLKSRSTLWLFGHSWPVEGMAGRLCF